MNKTEIRENNIEYFSPRGIIHSSNDSTLMKSTSVEKKEVDKKEISNKYIECIFNKEEKVECKRSK
jgi:hypothetical protein